MSTQNTLMLVLWIAGIIITVGLFVTLRALVLWYFGITEHLANQKRIIELLERTAPPQPTLSPRPAANPLTKTPNVR